jgi:hypothetical protein
VVHSKMQLESSAKRNKKQAIASNPSIEKCHKNSDTLVFYLDHGQPSTTTHEHDIFPFERLRQYPSITYNNYMTDNMAVLRLQDSHNEERVDAKDVLYYLEERAARKAIDSLACNAIWSDEDVNKLDTFLRNHKSTVRNLQLSNNNLTDVSSASLARIIQSPLRQLDLSNNQIRSKGLAKLKIPLMREDCNLKVLNLSNNRLGSAGGSHLLSIIQHNTSITTLNLAHNQLGKRGLKAILPGLLKNKHIRNLDLSHNGIGDSGALLFAPVLDPEVSESRVVRIQMHVCQHERMYIVSILYSTYCTVHGTRVLSCLTYSLIMNAT